MSSEKVSDIIEQELTMLEKEAFRIVYKLDRSCWECSDSKYINGPHRRTRLKEDKSIISCLQVDRYKNEN
jgi:hypothetical protein